MTFFSNNFAAIIGLAFILFVVLTNSTMEKRDRYLYFILFILEIAELFVYNGELWTATFVHPNFLRMLMTACGYVLRTLTMYVFIKLIQVKEKSKISEFLLILPMVFTFVDAFSVFFTDIFYSFTDDNVFKRGPLGTIPFICSFLYLIILLFKVTKSKMIEKRLQIPIVFLIFIFISGATLLELNGNKSMLRISTIYSTVFFLFSNQIYSVYQSIKLAADNKKEQEERKRLEALYKELQNRMHIIGGLSEVYFAVVFADLDADTLTVVQDSERLKLHNGNLSSVREDLNHWLKSAVGEPYYDGILAFTDLKTLAARLQNRDSIVFEYQSVSYGWARAKWIVTARDPDGTVTKALYAAEDIDEQVRAREEAQKKLSEALENAQQANRAKTVFLNNMSHDIRTPMNAIIGFASLAITHIDKKEQTKDYLSKIMTASNHLLSLINDVLDMSRIESGRVKIEERECCLPDMLHDLRNILQSDISSKKLNFFIDTVDVVTENIICDRLRLNQILLNCISNAVKYTKETGTVCIRVIEKPSRIQDAANFTFVVKDTGIGMTEEFLTHLFEPFSREETATVSGIQGTGLGMAITKNLVDLMDGHIEVTSQKDVGTEFRISFDFKKGTRLQIGNISQKLKGVRVLVVDDNEDSCISVSHMLASIGLEPEWTTSGQEAMELAKTAVAEKQPYGIYMIDWLMPGFSGTQVVRNLRSIAGNAPSVIVISAYDWADIEEEALAAGVNTFCAKPLFLSDLYHVLGSCTVNPDKAPAPVSAQTSDAEFHGQRILLAEDVEMNREIAAELLEDMGLTVETAVNGEEAVRMFCASAADRYALIFMDIQMPVMDGYEAAKAIRASAHPSAKQIPIIAMTANAFLEDIENAKNAGMNDHLAKPISVAGLKDILIKYVQ